MRSLERSRARKGEAGLTLIEILVATAVLAVAILVALLIYDQSRKSFKRGENAAEQQQAVRIAYDRMAADIRMAGYNYNPDGDTNRPDEQIEGAFDGAIVVRGDFDRTEETPLEGGGQTVVSVGNDEIVVYALGKPNWSGGQTLTFNADVKDAQRDSVVETVNIPNVALTQTADEAPYTLYRITLNPDTSTWGSPNFIVRTPLVENVRSMAFQFFDANDALMTVTGVGGAETPAAKGARTQIRKINISLTGMSKEPDLGWKDPNDTNAHTQPYRKFNLSGDITPRNLGMKGIKDIASDNTPPTKPGTPTLTTGHCGGLLLAWPANPSNDGVTSYKVEYGTASGNYSGLRQVGTNAAYISGLATGTRYYVAITAMDAAGNPSPRSNEANAVVANTTTPSAPSTVVATDDLTGLVKVSWTEVKTNTAPLAGDPLSPQIRDLAGYRIYRATSATFTPAAGNRIADETTVKPSANPRVDDVSVVNCQQYYYKVTAVDTCATESAAAPATPEGGLATTSYRPAAPANAQAFVAGVSTVALTWDKVTSDMASPSNAIYIDSYKVYRSRIQCDDFDTMCQLDVDPTPRLVTSGGVTTATDSTGGLSGTKSWYYRVSAVDACPGGESDLSPPAKAQCAFVGDIAWINPATNGQPMSGGANTISIRVDNAAADLSAYGSAVFTFVNNGTGESSSLTALLPDISSGKPVYSVNWLAIPAAQYAITAVVNNTSGCSKASSINVNIGSTAACCLHVNVGQVSKIADCFNTSGTGANKICTDLVYDIYNNDCLTAARIDSMTVTWTNNTGTNAKLTNFQFPTGTVVWNAGGASSPASNTFAAGAQPSVPYSTSGKVTLRFAFSAGMVRGNVTPSKNQPFRNTFNFTLLDSQGNPSEVTGTCGPSGEFSMSLSDQKTP